MKCELERKLQSGGITWMLFNFDVEKIISFGPMEATAIEDSKVEMPSRSPDFWMEGPGTVILQVCSSSIPLYPLIDLLYILGRKNFVQDFSGGIDG